MRRCTTFRLPESPSGSAPPSDGTSEELSGDCSRSGRRRGDEQGGGGGAEESCAEAESFEHGEAVEFRQGWLLSLAGFSYLPNVRAVVAISRVIRHAHPGRFAAKYPSLRRYCTNKSVNAGLSGLAFLDLATGA